MPSYLDLDDEKGYSKLIEKLVEAKSLPIKQLEKDKSKEKLKIEVINDLTKEISSLKRYADQLFGFDSIFNKKKFSSSDPSVLGGSAKHNTPEGQFKIKVLNLAKSHRIASKPIKLDDFIPAGTFKLKVSGTKLSFDFKGGNIRDLEKLINKSIKKRSEKAIKFNLIKKKGNQFIAIISSLKTGNENKIKLSADSDGLLQELGFFKKNTFKNASLLPKNFKPKGQNNTFTQNQIKLSPLSKEKIDLGQSIFNKRDKLNFTVSWKNLKDADERLSSLQKDENLEFNKRDTILLEELSFNSASLVPFVLHPKNKKEPDSSSQSLNSPIHYKFLTLSGGGDKPITTVYQLPRGFAESVSGQQNYETEAEEFFGEGKKGVLTDMNFTNGNVFFELNITVPMIKRENAEDAFVPANEVMAAENAKIEYQGVKLERNDNRINDLIDGVSLELKKVSEENVDFNIDNDHEFIFGQIINFIGQFNIYMGKINMLLSSESAPEDAEEIDKKKYGLFRDEITLKLMRDKLYAVTINSHPTSSLDRLSLLSQLGISSVFILGNPDDLDNRKLDFQEDTYRSFYDAEPELVPDLFGYDSNGDRIIDSGVAFKVSELAKQYIGSASIFELKKNVSKTRIENLNKDIEKKEEEIQSYRAEQEEEFAKLNSAQQQLEKMQDLLKNSLQ